MKTIIYDYGKLKERIKRKYDNQSSFASLIGMSYSTLNLKLNNKATFTQNEIEKIVEILGLTRNELSEYFFTIVV